MEQFNVLLVGAATAGEGVTASMVQLDLAVKVVNRLLGEKEYLTRAQLWRSTSDMSKRRARRLLASLRR